MRKEFKIIAVFLFFLVSGIRYPGQGIAGTGKTGAEFLLIGDGARSAGMANAYTAMSRNSESVYWNPAGISKIIGSEISGMHSEWLDDLRYETVSYCRNIGRKAGAIGFNSSYLHTGEFTGRNLAGKETENFRAYDLAAALSYGNKVSNKLSLGVNVKYIQQKIENESARGVAFDFGSLYEATEKITLGFSLKNLGPPMKFVKEEFSLPLSITLGGAYKIMHSLSLALDVKYQPIDKEVNFSLGTEYFPVAPIALRGGYLIKALQTASGAEGIGNFSGLGAGVGFKLRNYQMDYAFTPFGELGDTHRFSFSVGFGNIRYKE